MVDATPAPRVVTTTIGDATVGVQYQQRLQAQDGTRPLTWSLNAGAGLSWIRMEATTGDLTGTPPEGAASGLQLTVRVTDAAARSSTATFAMRVRECADGQPYDCFDPVSGVCQEGTRTCAGGTLGACSLSGPSTNPGACGTACAPCGANATGCEGGACVCGGSPACTGDKPDCCGARCTNTQTDAEACGADCAPCPAYANVVRECVGGQCSTQCEDGWARCGAGVGANSCDTDIRVDPNNCGGCGNPCFANVPNGTQSCSAKVCNLTCTGTWRECNGSSADGCDQDMSSVASCGACNNACADLDGSGVGTPVCNPTAAGGFECGFTCPSTHVMCNGNSCRPSDPENCGTCGNRCALRFTTQNPHATTTCAEGKCGLRCDAGWDDCNKVYEDGCEMNILTTEAHCGGCGVVCLGTCSGGRCCEECAGILCCAPDRCATRPTGVEYCAPGGV